MACNFLLGDANHCLQQRINVKIAKEVNFIRVAQNGMGVDGLKSESEPEPEPERITFIEKTRLAKIDTHLFHSEDDAVWRINSDKNNEIE